MAGTIVNIPVVQFFDNNGDPLSGGEITTYLSNTSTPAGTWQNEALSIANTNPIELNSRGEATIWLTPDVQYTFEVRTSTGSLIQTINDIYGSFQTINGLDASVVSYTPSGTGAVATTVEQELLDYAVFPESFMTSADRTNNYLAPGNANVTYAFSAAKAKASLSGKAIVLNSKAYKIDAGFNYAAQGLNIIGTGTVRIILDGSGEGFVLDTDDVDGAFLEEMRIENLLIIGNVNITNGFHSRGIVRSVFRNIEVRECNQYAFNILHGVSNTYDSFRYSASGQTTTPVRGVRLANNGSGYYTANCTFINLVSEDFSGTGLYLEDASGNTFIGGTYEGCGNGLVILPGCRRNNFKGVWFELNSSKDLSDDGVANTYDDCFFVSASSSPTVIIGSGKGSVFKGGYIRTANLQSTSSNTTFLAVGFDENLSGTLGITGPGTYKSFSCTKIDGSGNVVGVMPDIVGDSGTWTPIDASGAGLALSVSGNYTKIGAMVFAQGTVSFPITANVTSAIIGGLPFDVANLTAARQGFISFSDEPALSYILPNTSAKTFSLLDSSGSPLTNAQMSGKSLFFTVQYFVQ